METKKYHFVYKTTNLINGKYYIGKHSSNVLNDRYLGSGINLLKSIKKYGRKNFNREILELCYSESDAYLLEEQYVTNELINDPQCYNLVTGGGSVSGLKHSVETKQHLRDILIGKTYEEIYGNSKSLEIRNKIGNSHRGMKRTPETKANISKSRIGLKHSDETKQRLSIIKTGKKIDKKLYKTRSDNMIGWIYAKDTNTNEIIRIKRDDPRWANKELVGHAKGRKRTDETKSRISEKAFLTTDEFIKKSTIIYGDRYDYSKTIYTGGNNKLIITCKIHGDYIVRPVYHYLGGECKCCKKLKRKD